MKTLDDYYPIDSHTVKELTDKQEAMEMYNSKASSTWGAGNIGDTDYYQLSKPSLGRGGKKRLVFVCKKNLLGLT